MASTDTGDIEARLATLTKLDADQREALSEDLGAMFDQADADGDETAMQTAIDALKRIDVYEQLLEDLIAEEEDGEDGIDDNEPDETDEADAPEGADEQGEDAPETADTVETPEATAEGDTGSEVQAMAAAAVETPAEDADKGALVASLAVTPRAGAEISGYTAGQAFSSAGDIALAMSERLRATQGMADGLKSVVASLRADFPESRELDPNNSNANAEKIQRVTSESAIVASGGFCAPLPVNYDIFGVGSTARPVRDSLPTFGATRGGIRYIQPPVLGSYTGALSLWTALNDVNPTTPATKPVLKVNCANELTASTDAITLSLEFGNLMTRAFPELVQRHNQLALIEHARFAEKTLLAKISALSSKVTVAANQGTARDLLSAVARSSAQYRNRHRIPRGVQLRLLMPDWTLDAIREDIASNYMVGRSDINLSDDEVRNWFSTRGFQISWYMDDNFAAQAAGGALNGWPETIKFWLFAEGSLLFLDGGTLDLGVIRDADLVSTNDYVTFVETFEGVAKVGLEVLEVSAATGIGTTTPIRTDEAA